MIVADQLPLGKGADLELALHGGEDYELLLRHPEAQRFPARLPASKSQKSVR
jgi:thiamine monophosphate kinase